MKILVLILLLVSCATNQQTTTPKPQPTKPEENNPTEVLDLNKSEVFNIVRQFPECKNYFWKNRGRAYESYMRGIALMYAKQVCSNNDFIRQKNITDKFKTYRGYFPMQDALKYYGIAGNELNTYTFLTGLGMRESNGKYCKGRDKSRNFKKGESAEAGIYQVSYVSRVFNDRLFPLYQEYLSGKKSCELETFKSKKFSCTEYDAKIYGTGEGRNFQALMKRCPAFAVEWAAILIRSQYKHFGPIIRKEVEFKNQCRDMLKKVESYAKKRCK